MLEIIAVEDPDEIRSGVEVIKKAWGAIDLATILKDIITGIKSNGGLVLIAKDEDKVVGISFGFIGYKNSKMYFYSHMTGVAQDYRKKDIGKNLKLKQREWAKKQNIDLISWTFDPLQGLNSNFNLRKLGAISRVYLENHYGTMTDSLNRGLRSDRLVAEWYINSEYVAEKLKGTKKSYVNLNKSIITKEAGDIRIIENIDLNLEDDTILIEIPKNIVSIKEYKPEEAVRWRTLSAKVYEHYFSKGYALLDFYTEDNANYQVASKILPDMVPEKSIFLE
ncbi:MAG: GNAT family N-acetyltransferase [Thermoplasmata archaeon]